MKGSFSLSFSSNPVHPNIFCFLTLNYLDCLEAKIDGRCRLEQDDDYFKDMLSGFIISQFFTYLYVCV